MHSGQDRRSDNEVLVRVEGVSKKFCRDLKRSLWYGVCDSLAEFSFSGAGRADEGKCKQLRKDEFWAVNDVSFELRRGECLGLIGHNGAGKTTLLKMLNGLIKPDAGAITMRGRVGALIALGAGFNPILTGRENIYINGSVLGLSKKEIDGKIDGIIDFAEIGEFIDTPVQNYSSGMQVRLGFAVATAMNPDVLLLDEVLAVGDANFRSKCYQRVGEVVENCAVVFVSHDAYSVRRICNEVLWLKRGRQMFRGDTETGMQRYSEDSPEAEHSEVALFCGDYVSQLKCDAKVTERKITGADTATDIEVDISFESSRDVELGLCMANVVAPGEHIVGQSLLADVLNPIRKGQNSWRFTVRDLHLAKGSYSLVVGIFERGSKRLAMSLRHHIKFEVSGSPRYGPLYAPIAYKHVE